MRTVRGLVGRVAVAGILGTLVALTAASCSSSEDDGLVTKELARQEVGPAGGTVVGGPVTIVIPEGALTETKTILINEADPKARQLPADTAYAGGLYVLQPEDVTFAKLVTVTVQIDETKKRADAKGALVLFRGTGAGAWKPYAADEVAAKVVTGKTNHFSMWAPTTAAESYCYLNQCGPFALANPADLPPERSGELAGIPPGLDCRVPKVGDTGVVCAGTGQVTFEGTKGTVVKEKGPPYECHCAGSDVVLGSWPKLPPDTAITAMALQCGAPACPPKPTSDCDLGMVCDDAQSTLGNFSCSTMREPRVICNGTSCSCTTGQTFTLPKNAKPTNDELAALWVASCGGVCGSDDPNAEWVCPGTLGLELPGGGCAQETAGTCRDNHVYRTECEKFVSTTPGSAVGPVKCRCLVDGVEKKTVTSICPDAYWSCGFPKMQGEVPTGKQCPILVDDPIYDGPVTNPTQPPPPVGCRVQTGGTCRDGHTYSAECAGERFDVAMPCKCMVDGVANGKTVNAACMEAPAACGFPASR